MEPIVFEYGTRKKYRPNNATEYRMIPTLTCEEFGLYSEGDGQLLFSQIATLLDKHYSACVYRPVRVLRGATSCFVEMPINVWAKHKRIEHIRYVRKYSFGWAEKDK